MTLYSVVIFIALLFAGGVIGAIDSVTGGGSLFLVAVLSIFNLSPLEIIITMRFVTLLTESAGTLHFIKDDTIVWRQALLLGAAAFAGSLIGALLVTHAPEQIIRLITVGSLLMLMPLIPNVHKKQLRFPLVWIDRLYQKLTADKLMANTGKELSILVLICFGLGVYGGFLGAGFQSMLLIILSLMTPVSFMVAAGNAKFIAFLVSLAAGGIFLFQGQIAWDLFLPLTAGGLIGAWKGVDLIEKVNEKYVQWLLYAVVMISIMKMVAR